MKYPNDKILDELSLNELRFVIGHIRDLNKSGKSYEIDLTLGL